MSEQEILLLDKWLESVYHLKRMEEFWKELDGDISKRKNNSQHFKYEFNAFINSIRSVTFVMQKCFKNKHIHFEEWYLEIQNFLKESEFSKSVNTIRTLNQKEGNFHPDLIEVRNINNYFNTETTFTPIPPKQNKLFERLKLSELEKNKLSERNISNFQIVSIPSAFKIEMTFEIDNERDYEQQMDENHEIAIKECIKQEYQKKMEITEEELKNTTYLKFKLKVLNRVYEWSEFKKECYDLVEYLKAKSKEGIEKFK
ncbi:hypothetical protein ACM55I_07350 [Flavobacterium sp. GB2R13]|uniref:hypothetical protein n=1 Tax=Flavobacterium algoris TaxID=3398733 RepID=UPI003A8820AA